MARTIQSWLLGGGWSPVDSSEGGPFRWIEGPAASLLLPLERSTSAHLRVQAFAREAEAEVDLVLAVDGKALPARRLEAGWHWYEWPLDAPLTATLHQLTFSVLTGGRPADPKSVAISEIGGRQ